MQAAGSLSRLFSESTTPYLDYRLAENIFCYAFDAENKSRSDNAVDAVIDQVGFGIKTFKSDSNQKYEKIAEFNAAFPRYKNLDIEKKINAIADLRNMRLTFAKSLYGLETMLYHYLTRRRFLIEISEVEMLQINQSAITNIRRSKGSIFFNDGRNEYKFSETKSVLYQRFDVDKPIDTIQIKLLEEPLMVLEQLVSASATELSGDKNDDVLFLSLYSTRGTGEKFVPEKSGLNQWNAAGRERDPDEVYIPIPIAIHQKYPNFFPKRDTKFILHLPNKNTLSVKLCQDNSKALMSDPNKALGRWLLRDILKLGEGELLTYSKLVEIGVDSVKVRKIDQINFEIDIVSRKGRSL